MLGDLQLRGMAERTQEGYLHEVRKLACYYSTSPDQLTEQQVADYLLYLINDCEFTPGTLRVSYSGIKFFYTHTCPRNWNLPCKLKIPRQKTMPDVLTISEVHQLNSHPTRETPVRRAPSRCALIEKERKTHAAISYYGLLEQCV